MSKDLKKVLVSPEIKSFLTREKNFLNRTDIRQFTANTHEEALDIHRAEKLNLIITQLDLPAMSSENFCSLLREDGTLRKVSVMIVCGSSPADKAKSTLCKANAVLTRPLNPGVLIDKAQQLLDISWREAYRVLLSVSIDGSCNNDTFFCKSQNISTTGMLIETDRPLSLGNRLVCSFFLPNASRITAVGDVVRVIKKSDGNKMNHHFGVKFAELSSEARTAMETFVRTKAQHAQQLL